MDVIINTYVDDTASESNVLGEYVNTAIGKAYWNSRYGYAPLLF